MCVEALNDLGLSNNLKEKYKEAIKCFQEALEILPDDPILYDNLGFSYYALQDYDKAVYYYKKALLKNPNNTSTRMKLGEIYCDIKRDYKKAIQHFEKLLKLKPKNLDFCETLAFCYEKLHLYEKANKCREMSFK